MKYLPLLLIIMVCATSCKKKRCKDSHAPNYKKRNTVEEPCKPYDSATYEWSNTTLGLNGVYDYSYWDVNGIEWAGDVSFYSYLDNNSTAFMADSVRINEWQIIDGQPSGYWTALAHHRKDGYALEITLESPSTIPTMQGMWQINESDIWRNYCDMLISKMDNPTPSQIKMPFIKRCPK